MSTINRIDRTIDTKLFIYLTNVIDILDHQQACRFGTTDIFYGREHIRLAQCKCMLGMIWISFPPALQLSSLGKAPPLFSLCWLRQYYITKQQIAPVLSL